MWHMQLCTRGQQLLADVGALPRKDNSKTKFSPEFCWTAAKFRQQQDLQVAFQQSSQDFS
jgi:hypothetical protein